MRRCGVQDHQGAAEGLGLRGQVDPAREPPEQPRGTVLPDPVEHGPVHKDGGRELLVLGRPDRSGDLQPSPPLRHRGAPQPVVPGEGPPPPWGRVQGVP